MARTHPDQSRRLSDWIGIDQFGESDRRPDDSEPESKWLVFRDWLLGYRSIDIQDRFERRFPPRTGRRT